MARFGDYRVPVFDTLFSLRGILSLSHFAEQHLGPSSGEQRYLRWLSRQGEHRFPWADPVFEALADEWSPPSWFPTTDLEFPSARSGGDPRRHPFPARGLFICGPGGRTRLHRDPWSSDAVLCQVTGRKRVIVFDRDDGGLLEAAGSGDGGPPVVVDLARPDAARFPRYAEAVPRIDEILEPGDAVYIPADCHHTAIALDASVSLTWNFVHSVNRDRFAAHLAAGGKEDPTVRYFESLTQPDQQPNTRSAPR